MLVPLTHSQHKTQTAALKPTAALIRHFGCHWPSCIQQMLPACSVSLSNIHCKIQTKHFRINSHFGWMGCMSATSPGAGCTWRSRQESRQQRAVATARLCNTLECEISADRQLPGSEQINTISPGAFFSIKEGTGTPVVRGQRRKTSP